MQNNDFSPFGTDLFGEAVKKQTDSPIAKRFIFPPFSILNARDGDWQERKRAWKSIGIQSEVGRVAQTYNTDGSIKMGCASKLEMSDTIKREKPTADQALKNHVHSGVLHRGNTGIEWGEEYTGGDCWSGSGTSIFDPVVCELAYSWFTKEGSQVIDPFAGGSVRGIVAGCLGRNYWGGDLRQEQIDANRKQANDIKPNVMPQWVCGDSMETVKQAPNADFVFSCPPYGNLEVYSDKPEDISNMEHHTFIAAYKTIIHRTCARLKENRFACFVVGDFRDKRGYYRNFVSDTITAFQDTGLMLYNEAILVTSVGSASMRVGKQFESGRKFCKTHQNILVFCKGDWRKACEYLNGK